MYYFVAFIFCKAIHCEQSQLFHWMVLHLTDLKVEVTLRLMPFAVCWKNNDSYSWSVTGLNVYLDQIQYYRVTLEMLFWQKKLWAIGYYKNCQFCLKQILQPSMIQQNIDVACVSGKYSSDPNSSQESQRMVSVSLLGSKPSEKNRYSPVSFSLR